MTLAAFVPARSGSKRLPGKNVRDLGGKPLIIWSLEAFANAPGVDKVIFSTDSEEYWKLACDHIGEERLQLDERSPEEAGDKVKIFDYLVDAREKIFGDNYDEFAMGLPTGPFRNSRHVEESIALFHETGRPVFSAVEYDFHVSFAFYKSDAGWEALSEHSPMLTGNTRSQDQQVAYHPNGAIYVRKVEDLAQPGLMTLYEDAVPYIMDRKYSVDIDDDTDFRIAEALIEAGVVS